MTIGNESIDLMTPEAVDPADDVVGRARLGDLGRVIPRDALVGSVLADALISSFGVAVGSLLVDIVAKHRRRLKAVIGQR